MSSIDIDLSEFKAFFRKVDMAAKGDFKKEFNQFLEGIGYEFLRILQDEIIRRKTVDTRLLLSSFQKGSENGIWELSEGNSILEVGTNVEYASYVNDGHWTCEKGIKQRFVPGHWQGERFIYEPGSKKGMVLKQKWVEGSHYWESSLRILERIYPELLERKMQNWLDNYFG